MAYFSNKIKVVVLRSNIKENWHILCRESHLLSYRQQRICCA